MELGGALADGESAGDLFVGSQPLQVVNGLITGLHEPRATHLAMLQAFLSTAELQRARAEAVEQEYLWRKFGDMHLILP